MQIIPTPAATTERHRARLSNEYGPENLRYCRRARGRTDDEFLSMLIAYRCSGGLARDGELLAFSGRRSGLDADALARLITDQEVIGFDWQSRIWFPVFQFNLADMSRPPALRQVLAELAPVYDAWELVGWFAQPNAWLDDRAPADMLEHDPSAVLQAARADRFVVSS